MEIYDVSTVKPFINLLVYSEPGVGKTTLAASAQAHPELRDVLVLNIEGGLISVAGVKGLKAVDIKSVDHLEEVFWKITNKEKGFDRFKTVVIDSGSELQTQDLEMIATNAWNADQELPEQKRKRKSRDDLWQEDYGTNTAKLKRLFRWYRDAPFNTVITALSRENYARRVARNQDTPPKLESVTPAFTEKLGQAVMGYCDMVWYMYLDNEGNRKMLTRQEGVYRAKTRGHRFADGLGQVVDDPDLASIYDLLLSSEGFKNEKPKGDKPTTDKKEN